MPVARDEDGYFFKRSWLPWTFLHGQNPGGLRAATKALAKYPEAWQEQDCPLAPQVPFWRSLLLSEHPDRTLVPVVDKHWLRLSEDERNDFMAQALIHHRPLLADHLWNQGARWPQDTHVLQQVMTAWVAPNLKQWATHLGAPRWNDERINFYDAIKETTADFPMFHGKKMDELVGPKGPLPLWGRRLVEAVTQDALPVKLVFPMSLLYRRDGEPDTRVEAESSWGGYLLRFGMLAADQDVPARTAAPTTAIQLQQLAAMGLDFSTVLPPCFPQETPAESWIAYAQRHGACSPEIEACLRELQTPTPALRPKPRPRV